MANKKSSNVARNVIPFLAILHNASKGDNVKDDPTPWFVHIPVLGVSLQLINDSDEPVTGFINPEWASSVVQDLANRLVSDSEWRTNLRNKPQVSQLGSLYDKFGTAIYVRVYIPSDFQLEPLST